MSVQNRPQQAFKYAVDKIAINDPKRLYGQK